MTSLGVLRAEIKPDHQKLLDEIWQHYLSHNEWILVRQLHHPRRAREVREAVKVMGGGVMWDTERSNEPRYELTFLGVLLTSNGEKYENLLIRFLEYLRQRYEADFKFNIAEEKEVVASLCLTVDESQVLKELVYISDFSGGRRASDGSWSFVVPRDIDSYPEEPAGLRQLVEEAALKRYAPDIPPYATERQAYYASWIQGSAPADDSFSFVVDQALRQQLAQDWVEAEDVFSQKAWKATIIMCGSVLEGLLLDALSRCEIEALSTYKILREKPKSRPKLENMGLKDLLDVCERLELVSASSLHLGRALTEFRNLVHPGNQLRHGLEANEEQAGISINAIRMCLRIFAGKYATTSNISSGMP